jgi:hypothetical protein
MEEEALTWAILLFKKVYGLAPFPLSLPETVQELTERGFFRLRSPQRTEAEIRIKEKSLRDIRSFVSGLPEQGLLKYLNQTRFLKEGETLDEILQALRGEPGPQVLQSPSVLNGSILICLIHEWLLQEWAIDRSLNRVEELERRMIQGWQDPIGEDLSNRTELRPKTIAWPFREITCPLALAAWRILRAALFPEPWPLITTQPWVWSAYYGLDPWEEGTDIIPLPDIGPFRAENWEDWEARGSGENLRAGFAGLLKPLPELERQKASAAFQESLRTLGLPDQGRDHLILPPSPLSDRPTEDPVGRAAEMFLLVSQRA